MQTRMQLIEKRKQVLARKGESSPQPRAAYRAAARIDGQLIEAKLVGPPAGRVDARPYAYKERVAGLDRERRVEHAQPGVGLLDALHQRQSRQGRVGFWGHKEL